MNCRHLDIRLLRTFVAVARQTGFSRAADDVCRTQAAVSQQMKRLESAVGCQLLEREGRRKRLTDEGRRLLEYATGILNLNDEAISYLRANPIERMVRLGACADVGDTILPDYVARLARSRPSLQIDIQVGASDWLGGALRRGEIDVAIDVNAHEGFETHELQSSPLAWIASRRFCVPRDRVVPLALLDTSDVFRRTAVRTLEQAKRPWRAAFQSSTLCGLRAGVRAGLGITPHFTELVTPDLTVVGPEFGLPSLPPISFQMYSRRDRRDDAMQKFMTLLGAKPASAPCPVRHIAAA
jgi:DNA-binding transcriptional LysR family regulator